MGGSALDAKSHFVDLGAGFGKVVFGAALLTEARATGVELMTSRLSVSQEILRDLGGELPVRRIELLHGDVTDMSVYRNAGFTHVFAFDAAFDPRTRDGVARVLRDVPSWRVLVSCEKLAAWRGRGLDNLRLVETVSLTMSVSGERHAAFVYVRVGAGGAEVAAPPRGAAEAVPLALAPLLSDPYGAAVFKHVVRCPRRSESSSLVIHFDWPRLRHCRLPP